MPLEASPPADPPGGAGARRRVGWLCVLRFELRKALHARATWISLGLPALLAAAAVCAAHFAQRARLAEREAEGNGSAFLPFAQGASGGLVLAGILVLFFASGAFSNEGSQRTYKAILIRPHARGEWVAAKWVLALAMSIGSLLLVITAAVSLGALLGDYTDIAEEGYVIYAADWMRAQSALAVLLVVPPLMALTSFGLMISALTDHSGIAAGVSIGGYMLLEVVKGSVGDGRVWLFNSFMPSLLDTSYLDSLRGLADGMSDAAWDPAMFWYNAVVPLVWALLFGAVAWLRFRSREFAL